MEESWQRSLRSRFADRVNGSEQSLGEVLAGTFLQRNFSALFRPDRLPFPVQVSTRSEHRGIEHMWYECMPSLHECIQVYFYDMY